MLAAIQMVPRIKLCGFRDATTARAAAMLGADAIGLVFHAASPRHVSTEAAVEIVAALPAFVSSVGLFVDADASYVRAILDAVPLDILQFHGDESPDYCSSFGRPYIKAIRVRPETDLVECARLYRDARGLLCDAYSPLAHGGTGEQFDWGLIPAHLSLPLILSGGLTLGNVAAAIAQVEPWAVDVSSGIESTRGVKDIRLIEQFIRAVKH